MCPSDSQMKSVETHRNNSKYQISAARFYELQLRGKWEGFRLAQRDCSKETPHLDLIYDGKDLSVKEIAEVETRPEEINLWDCIVGGFFMDPEPNIYKTHASYNAWVKWEQDGSLTWQSPHGYHEGGKVWKLDRARSDQDRLRWICENDVFFWRRVPDTAAQGTHDSCWHGVYKMLHKQLIQWSGCNEINSDAAGHMQSLGKLPNLLSSSRHHTKMRIDPKQVNHSPNNSGLPNLLGKCRHCTEASVEKKKSK
eukprot:gnl/MRDRNA2_/MRDRNA2_88054_c0_seq1.p1 gnl/MRDRNA2_/MRDRNA2_88054_c0~~gnl/MRDRNA2_/MRDRNA2_88054_c0_seq1.p1  ORF type:complete len:253 (-),score=33.34 gnl/MRDRNA2_/MRDRNA2_88054_c0_seq1:682-1440(-)